MQLNKSMVYIMGIDSGTTTHRIPLPKKLFHGEYFQGGMVFDQKSNEFIWMARGLDNAPNKAKVYLYRYSLQQKKVLPLIELKNSRRMYGGMMRSSSNGKYLVIVGVNAVKIHLVDLKNRKDSLISLKSPASFVGFTSDQQHLIIASLHDKKIIIHNIKTGKETASSIKLVAHEIIADYGGADYITQSSDLKYLAIGLKSHARQYHKDKILLFNAQNGEFIRRYEIPIDEKPVKKELKKIEPIGGFFSQQVR